MLIFPLRYRCIAIRFYSTWIKMDFLCGLAKNSSLNSVIAFLPLSPLKWYLKTSCDVNEKNVDFVTQMDFSSIDIKSDFNFKPWIRVMGASTVMTMYCFRSSSARFSFPFDEVIRFKNAFISVLVFDWIESGGKIKNCIYWDLGRKCDNRHKKGQK